MNNEEMSGLDQAFNTVEAVGEEIVPKKETPKKVETQDQVQDDYEYARGNLYQLVDKGQEAVNGALDLACLLYTSPSPRDS